MPDPTDSTPPPPEKAPDAPAPSRDEPLTEKEIQELLGNQDPEVLKLLGLC